MILLGYTVIHLCPCNLDGRSIFWWAFHILAKGFDIFDTVFGSTRVYKHLSHRFFLFLHLQYHFFIHDNTIITFVWSWKISPVLIIAVYSFAEPFSNLLYFSMAVQLMSVERWKSKCRQRWVYSSSLALEVAESLKNQAWRRIFECFLFNNKSAHFKAIYFDDNKRRNILF